MWQSEFSKRKQGPEDPTPNHCGVHAYPSRSCGRESTWTQLSTPMCASFILQIALSKAAGEKKKIRDSGYWEGNSASAMLTSTLNHKMTSPTSSEGSHHFTGEAFGHTVSSTEVPDSIALDDPWQAAGLIPAGRSKADRSFYNDRLTDFMAQCLYLYLCWWIY